MYLKPLQNSSFDAAPFGVRYELTRKALIFCGDMSQKSGLVVDLEVNLLRNTVISMVLRSDAWRPQRVIPQSLLRTDSWHNPRTGQSATIRLNQFRSD
jgi:hypothetical protein